MIYLIFAMLAVIWFDGTRYIIPNWLVGSLLALYPLAVYETHTPVNWQMALVGMLVVFALGYIVFMLKWMAAGDVKLIVACGLWVGFRHLADFIFILSIFGGIFAVIVWLTRKALPFIPKAFPKKPRILRDNEPIPYGLAIALGFLVMMWQGQILH